MKIRYVNGYKIRQFLDPDFCILHLQRHDELIFDSKWYIPKRIAWYIPRQEVWCDWRFKNEANFLLKVETSGLRSRTAIVRRFTKKGPRPNVVVRRFRCKNPMVALVNGALVRQYLDPQFVMGGHDLVYSYIPKNEIWIDAAVDSRDIPHTLLHEMIERKLMKGGKTYDIAHDWATATEKESRRKAGGSYPGDANYPYKNLEELLKAIYVRSN